MLPRALTIAGSDSGGGAGIQADLKTFTVFGVYGTTAITALTAQNTTGVGAVHAVPPEFVRAQLEAVLGDIGTDAAKTGMLASAAVVREVARALREHGVEKLVVDPVMVAQSGAALIEADAVASLRADLIPLAALLTPNVPEAERLAEMSITSLADMRAAARRLIERGARAVLLKGGHLEGEESIDVFDDGRVVQELRAPRIESRHTHGTGCQLSAAITAGLAMGHPLPDAILEAKRFISVAIAAGLALGNGDGPANPLAWRRIETEWNRDEQT
jgi:hydroxymethylpyrimidine/phosphomethylpyrimidine kinase